MIDLHVRHPEWNNEKLAKASGSKAKKKAVLQSIVSQTLSKPEAKYRMDILLNNVGFTREFAAKKIKEGLDATQTHFFIDKDSRKVPDYATRKGYLELASKLRGDLKLEEDDAQRLDAVFSRLTDDRLILFITKKIGVDELLGESGG